MPATLKPRATLIAAATVCAIAAAACAPASNPPDIPVQAVSGGFVVSVVDSLYDAGRSSSVLLDKDGNPVVAYLLYQPVLKTGEIPPGIRVGDPQPPAVVLATQTQGIWSRASVTPQKSSPAQGDAPELANDKGQSVAGVNQAAAIDGQGKLHVVWATPTGVFSTSGTAGTFAEKESVTGSAALGASIAVAPDGTPWVTYYDRDSVVAATRGAGGWTRETVRPQTGQLNAPASVTAVGVGADGQPVVAFGDHGQTMVATRSEDGTWSVAQIDGEGGYGVSLAIDGDGNGHVAYYDLQGIVHEADQSGGAWTATDVATTGPGAGGTSDGRWSTGIGVDDQGARHVAFADTVKDGIYLATGDGGGFSAQRVDGSEHGANPSLAVSADGAQQVVAWFDIRNANLAVAQTGIGGLAIAHPTSPAALPSPGATVPTEAPCSPSGTQVQVAAVNLAFDTDCLAAPAGEAFAIVFDNQEAVPHNVDIYDQAGGSHIGGSAPTDIFTGPGTMEFASDPLDQGIYYFQCDVHPQQMFGTFVVGTP